MRTEILDIDNPSAIKQALEVLTNGGLVAFPTDTVYGIGALVHDATAVESIYNVKERPNEKAIPVLLSSEADLARVAAAVNPIAQRLAKRFWPGALTLVLEKHPSIPEVVSASQTVGVRVPDYPPIWELFRLAGPLAVTSANISGQPSPATADEVFAQLSGRIPIILNGGRTLGGVPSTVVDCTREQPVILRQGPVTNAQILSELKK